MKTQYFQKKSTQEFQQEIADVANSLNKVSLNTDEFNSAIKAIYKLCQNQVLLQLKQQRGHKVCAFCLEIKQGEQFQCETEDCGQIYHIECVNKEIHTLAQEAQRSIDQSTTLEQVENFEIQLKVPCKSCQQHNYFSRQVEEYLVNELNNLEASKSAKKESIREQITSLKTKQSSCGLCNEHWVLPNLKRKIFNLDPFDDRNLAKTRKLEQDNKEDPNAPVKETYWIRFQKCKHLFCKECLVAPVAKAIYFETATVEGKQLYNRIQCPDENCNELISFRDIERILSNKFNWFLRYKHNLMMNCVKSFPEEIQFVQCLGVYKINSQNCDQSIYEKIESQIAIQKEIFETFQEDQLDLSQLKASEKKDGERLVPCGRVYQKNSKAGQDIHQFIQQFVKAIEDDDEKDNIEGMLEEYENTGVIKLEELEGQPDKNMIKCKSGLCQFHICLNGCFTVHKDNVCPLQGQDNPNNPVIVPIHKVVKEIKQECLYFARSDNIIVSCSSNFCSHCFRQLKVREGVKPTDQIIPGYFVDCECQNEFEQQQPDEEEEEEDQEDEEEDQEGEEKDENEEEDEDEEEANNEEEDQNQEEDPPN